jgi:hypothetical protein
MRFGPKESSLECQPCSDHLQQHAHSALGAEVHVLCASVWIVPAVLCSLPMPQCNARTDINSSLLSSKLHVHDILCDLKCCTSRAIVYGACVAAVLQVSAACELLCSSLAAVPGQHNGKAWIRGAADHAGAAGYHRHQAGTL